ASPDLWGAWVGNHPGLPGPTPPRARRENRKTDSDPANLSSGWLVCLENLTKLGSAENDLFRGVAPEPYSFAERSECPFADSFQCLRVLSEEGAGLLVVASHVCSEDSLSWTASKAQVMLDFALITHESPRFVTELMDFGLGTSGTGDDTIE